MLGIVCPYGWGESTRLAFLLAEHLQRLGMPCRWLSVQIHEQHLHAHWDARVQPYRQDRFEQWLAPLSTIVWFVGNREALFMAAKAGKQNLRVVLHSNMQPGEYPWLSCYSKLLLPTPTLAGVLETLQLPHNVCRWLPPVIVMPRRELRQPGQLRVWWPIRGNLSRDPQVHRLILLWWVLMERHKHVQLTISYTRQFCPSAAAELQRMQGRMGSRLTVLRKLPYEAQRQQPVDHDVMYWHFKRDSSGIEITEALVAHTPVWSLRGEAAVWLVRDGKFGSLLSHQEERRLGDGSSVMHWRMQALTAFLNAKLANPEDVATMRQQDWFDVVKWRRIFEGCCDDVCGVTSSFIQ